jgi:hypothetical protein
VNLRAEYLQKFSEQQSEVLIRTNNYNLITDNWTSIGIYLPVIPQKFQVSTAIDADVTKRYNYPPELSVTHTRFWQSPKFGRVFFTLNAKAFINNSVQSGMMYRADVTGASSINGTNTIAINNGDRYIGNYRNFVTPVVAGKLVYLPMDSHVGISLRMEKNFGTYKALNAILGVPIVLIDKKGVPAINFEAQLLFTDLNSSVKGGQLPFNKNAIGLTVSVPFSKIVY